MRRQDRLWWWDASLSRASTHQLWLTCSCLFYTPASPTLPCFPRSLYIGSSVGTVLLKLSNIRDAQVCILISCKVQVCLQFLDRPSISVTDQVCFWWLIVNINWPNFLSVCFVTFPFLILQKNPKSPQTKKNPNKPQPRKHSHIQHIHAWPHWVLSWPPITCWSGLYGFFGQMLWHGYPPKTENWCSNFIRLKI